MVLHSEFLSEIGLDEHFFAAESRPGRTFREEAAELMERYAAACAEFGCSPESEVLLRFHLSDVVNQAAFLKEMLKGRQAFLSFVGQPPAEGSRLALEAWHWKGDIRKSLCADSLDVLLRNYKAFWFHVPELHGQGSLAQTLEEFELLKSYLADRSVTVESGTVRTWLYCRDVDNNYKGLVKARNDFFSRNGLNKETHFIASTGIEGQASEPSRIVAMDSISYAGLRTGQQIWLSAPEHLSPTTLYGVSFERGTRLVFGDRSHYLISGTASIDGNGAVVHPFDVARQTERLLENVGALLESSGGKLSDLRAAAVYLRDPADSGVVRSILKEALPPGFPFVTVRAPVCRPAWLVEMECFGVNAGGNAAFPEFL